MKSIASCSSFDLDQSKSHYSRRKGFVEDCHLINGRTQIGKSPKENRSDLLVRLSHLDLIEFISSERRSCRKIISTDKSSALTKIRRQRWQTDDQTNESVIGIVNWTRNTHISWRRRFQWYPFHQSWLWYEFVRWHIVTVNWWNRSIDHSALFFQLCAVRLSKRSRDILWKDRLARWADNHQHLTTHVFQRRSFCENPAFNISLLFFFFSLDRVDRIPTDLTRSLMPELVRRASSLYSLAVDWRKEGNERTSVNDNVRRTLF